MPHNRYEWIDRLKSVEREHRVVETAIERLRLAVLEGKLPVPDGTTHRDLVAAGKSLEITYLVRLWAEFETALFSYYRIDPADVRPGPKLLGSSRPPGETISPPR
jgi:hypothetical protein